MAYDPNNIFARILRGEIPNRTVYEDDFVLAFHDINPQAPTHVLVIPKGAYTDLADFSARAGAEELTGFFRAVATIADQLGIVAPGFRALCNTGTDAHQEVPHFHLHLFAGKPLGPMLAR
jgi:diadenosine tetraphosphate (Ap4A) HIT family hydrolase